MRFNTGDKVVINLVNYKPIVKFDGGGIMQGWLENQNVLTVVTHDSCDDTVKVSYEDNAYWVSCKDLALAPEQKSGEYLYF